MNQSANLDFLRSIAVLAVVYAHTLYYNGKEPLIGWLGLAGVCFFFVHTSLVLMWSLERDAHVGRFYFRRAFRIYPLWCVVLSLVLVLRIPTSPLFAPRFGFHQPHAGESIQQAALIFNLYRGATVVGASWTLPLEVDMYLMLPALFFLVRGAKAVWPVLVLEAFAIVCNHPHAAAPAGADLLVTVPYFLGGIVAYGLTKRIKPWLPSWAFPVTIFLLIAIFFHGGGYREAWLLCLVLGTLIPQFREMTWRPLVRASELIARYSYGIYLCHFIAIAAGFYYLRGHSLVAQLCAYTVVICLLPVLLYHTVESPMIDLGRKLVGSRGKVSSTAPPPQAFG